MKVSRHHWTSLSFKTPGLCLNAIYQCVSPGCLPTVCRQPEGERHERDRQVKIKTRGKRAPYSALILYFPVRSCSLFEIRLIKCMRGWVYACLYTKYVRTCVKVCLCDYTHTFPWLICQWCRSSSMINSPVCWNSVILHWLPVGHPWTAFVC